MSAKMIGPRLKELRQSMKLSQWKMAELLCVSQSSIDRYERNTARPTAENFLVYADYFDVSLDYLIRGRSSSLPGDADVTQLKSDIEKLVKQLERFKTSL